jgi:peptide-methionine (S)-S-oxide reductase
MKVRHLQFLILGIVAALGIAACTPGPSAMAAQKAPSPPKSNMKDAKYVIVAGGCFWCVDAIYRDLKGVYQVESAYVGGDAKNPTYEEVCGGATGHAEAVKIFFDPKVVSKDELLKIFFTTHDPTTLNRQGNDYGTQYRSAIFFETPEEKAEALKVIAEVEKEKIWPNPIVTSVEPVKNYTRAEEYHQDYYAKFEKASDMQKMSMNAGYCRAVIEPKVRKFREKYAAKLRKG